jgi:pyrophosphatase PpaX
MVHGKLIPVVLFDFDGTLVDTIPLIVQSCQRALNAVAGLKFDDEEIKSWIGGGPLRTRFEFVSKGQGDQIYAAYQEWYWSDHDVLAKAFAGIPDLLRGLNIARRQCSIVTSKRRHDAQRGLQHTGLQSLISVAAAMEDTVQHKPGPAPLLYACHKLGVAPSDCVYVGDAVADMEAAAKAGMVSVGVTWGAGTLVDLESAAPSHIVDDPRALLDLLCSEGSSSLIPSLGT